ncbi:methylglutaconyl-CoA hydratase, mitochondrial-like [Anneissia japonica]|uniref:methylglutaconyl-CoA hydratase, mitochondrial-like n=1 Tax=Anneissia japonica TaxID=1529436 RepID=UPI0014255768|nr:methylglutaconyl-CoA hydratase, mitochondrial-like [Anneissia japonica]
MAGNLYLSLCKIHSRALLFPKRFLSPSIILQEIQHRNASTSEDELNVKYLEGDDEGIVVFGLNRPAAKNAVSRNLLKMLEDGLGAVRYDKNVRSLIIKSDVPGIFCAGADLKERVTFSPKEVAAFVDGVRKLTMDISNMPMPVIAAMDGTAVGGGLEFALACDMRTSTTKTQLGLVETRLAIIPGGGGTQRLARLVGSALAKELIFTARVFNGAEAARMGIVNHAVEQDESNEAAYKKALDIAREIIPQGPIAVQMAKLAINKGMEVDLTSGLAFEGAYYAQVSNIDFVIHKRDVSNFWLQCIHRVHF